MIFSIGYGALSYEAFVQALRDRKIQYLIDVRSVPASRYRPEFNREQLSRVLRRGGINYVFMGDQLGGRPEDPGCYINGKIQYHRVMETDEFRTGIQRLVTAVDKGLSIALMCSEGRPESCHRSKLIGVALENIGWTVRHLTPEGAELTQARVMELVTGGQEDLFGHRLTSRKRYGMEEEPE